MKKETKKPVKSSEPTTGWRLTMKDIPEKDRPYEKCEREGVGALTDAELLAILIRTGNRQESALSLATRILAQAQPPGILGLLHLTLPELMEQKGIGRVKGIELLCVGELSQRIWRTLTLSEAPAFTAPEAIARFLYGGNASQRAGRDAPDDPQYEAEADSGYPAVSGNLQSLSGVSEGDIYRGAALSCSQHRFST